MNLNSIKNAAEFVLINKHGVKYISPLLTLIVMPNFAKTNIQILQDKFLVKNLSGPHPSLTRFDINDLFLGFKISKKIGNAVKRNKLRRQIKALYLMIAQQHSNQYLSGSGIIIIARQALKQAKFDIIQADITKSCSYFKRKLFND